MCKCAKVLKNTDYFPFVQQNSELYYMGTGMELISTIIQSFLLLDVSSQLCRYSHEPCPSDLLTAGSTFLGLMLTDKCSDGRGGAVCRGCAPDYVFTFKSAMCVPQASCSWWQPYLILLLSILFQILIALLLVLVVRFKYTLGSGFLYGPMLFLALVNHLPLHNYLEYSTLGTAISVITSIPLLNLELF